jgi:hypothetical protein
LLFFKAAEIWSSRFWIILTIQNSFREHLYNIQQLNQKSINLSNYLELDNYYHKPIV